MGGVDQVSEGVSQLQKKSVSWGVGECRHWRDGILHNGVMLEILNKGGDSTNHPVEQK